MINNFISNKNFTYNIATGSIVVGSQYTSTEDFENLVGKYLEGHLSFLHVNIISLSRNKPLPE